MITEARAFFAELRIAEGIEAGPTKFFGTALGHMLLGGAAFQAGGWLALATFLAAYYWGWEAWQGGRPGDRRLDAAMCACGPVVALPYGAAAALALAFVVTIGAMRWAK